MAKELRAEGCNAGDAIGAKEVLARAAARWANGQLAAAWARLALVVLRLQRAERLTANAGFFRRALLWWCSAQVRAAWAQWVAVGTKRGVAREVQRARRQQQREKKQQQGAGAKKKAGSAQLSIDVAAAATRGGAAGACGGDAGSVLQIRKAKSPPHLRIPSPNSGPLRIRGASRRQQRQQREEAGAAAVSPLAGALSLSRASRVLFGDGAAEVLANNMAVRANV